MYFFINFEQTNFLTLGCLRLNILEQDYKLAELKVSYRSKALTQEKTTKTLRRSFPYGELFFERRDYWNTPYKFNAKELDAETGLYYYGARYYTPEVSIWLSVDKKANRAPQESPYAYCGNNPIVFIDPDGNFKRKFWARVYKLFYGGEYYYDNDRNEYYVAKPHNRKGNNNTTVDFGNNSTTLDPIEIGHDNKRAYNFKFFKGGLFYTKDSDDGLPQNQGPAIESDGDPPITDGNMMPGSNFGVHSGLPKSAKWFYEMTKGIVKAVEIINDLINWGSTSPDAESGNNNNNLENLHETRPDSANYSVRSGHNDHLIEWRRGPYNENLFENSRKIEGNDVKDSEYPTFD